LKLFLPFVFFSFYLFAQNDLIDYFRAGGKNLENKAKKLLQSKKYWLNRLESYDTEFGFYENIKYLLIVNKKFKSLDVWEFNSQKSQFEIVQTFDIFVGEKNGQKQKKGDLKTPTGTYQLTKQLYKLHQFYGPLAIVLSYPNDWDKSKNRTGGGIWIHGKPLNGQKRNNYTKGCLALDNQDLKKLNKRIGKHLKKTLVILEDGRLFDVSKNDLAIILQKIYQWLDAWQKKDFKKYIEFYSKKMKYRKKDSFKNFNWFKKYKREIFKKAGQIQIFASKINIAPYPNALNKELFLITFNEKYRSKTFNWTGQKTLIIELKNKTFQIILE